MSSQVLLDIENVSTVFKQANNHEVVAVDGVSLRIFEGQTVALVGESGSGKSALMQSVLGLIPKSMGRIRSGRVGFRGKDLLTLSEREMRAVRGNDIAMIFQDPMTSLNPSFTIGYQIVEQIRAHKNVSRKEARKKAAELLEAVGIPEVGRRLNQYPHEYSGGMRQRAMIAMALSCDPSLLIADEPTTALDVTIQAQILSLLRTLQNEIGMGLIMITHDLGVVQGFAPETNVMYAGEIVESGPTARILADPRHPYTIGLIGSIPTPASVGQRLQTIPGAPALPGEIEIGCKFRTRCSFSNEVCGSTRPILQPEMNQVSHLISCWVDVRTSEMRALDLNAEEDSNV